MGGFACCLFLVVCSFFFCFTTSITASAEPIKVSSSTQFLWGDDLLGDSQAVLAQYVRFTGNPEESRFSFAGYGRIWADLGNTKIRDTDATGRLYYLYIDYSSAQNTSLRLGRQYVNFAAGSSVIDGVSFSARNLGYFGITAAGGRDVIFSLDSEHSRSGNSFIGIGINLENVRATQLGISYVRKYDEWDLAREEFGMNFRYIYRYLSPYAEIRYDNLSKTVDEATVGLDIFPANNLMIKGEFYHSYPTFDSTSIYSVFAVNKYREYLARAEYSFDTPLTVYVSYARQTYEESDNADYYIVGVRVYPLKNLTLNASVDYRHGYGGNDFGFEAYGDYKVSKKLTVSAGAQYDSYRRPDFSEGNYDYAQRYWLGGKWLINKKVSLSARIEDNINENFNHRPLGRVSLNWNL